MCSVLLPPGGYPIAVNKYKYIISIKFGGHVNQEFLLTDTNIKVKQFHSRSGQALRVPEG
jgi:hypothetical protein